LIVPFSVAPLVVMLDAAWVATVGRPAQNEVCPPCDVPSGLFAVTSAQ
jgi:hypothetical protein